MKLATDPKPVTLAFEDWRSIPSLDQELRTDLSCLAVIDDTIFVACDETASIESLHRTGAGAFGEHQHIRLGDFFDLPDGAGGEMDIEGLAADAGRLWIVGSHSLKREKAKRHERAAEASLEAMTEIKRDPNRYFLGYLPLEREPSGRWRPVAMSEGLEAACLPMKKKSSRLIDWLEEDPHLAPFFAIPSKENGFDIEGLAVKGSRVWLGLRGPVLRRQAAILEFDFKTTGRGGLKARKIDGERRYRKHLLDTGALGVRDLYRHGEDLLILTGPTMAADGPARILRWCNATHHRRSGVIDPAGLNQLLDLPYRGDEDHPEGLHFLRSDGVDGLLVVHDSPSDQRLGSDPPQLVCDLYPLA